MSEPDLPESDPAKIHRVAVNSAPSPGNAGIRPRYQIDTVDWVWLPEWKEGRRVVADFQLTCEITRPETLQFEITADQRYQLQLNGQTVGRGPDRSELGGWSFHRYEWHAEPGEHALRVVVWWLQDNERPVAQVTARPALAVAGLGKAEAILSTGKAPWKGRSLGGWEMLPKDHRLHYHVIGSGFKIDGSAIHGDWQEPVSIGRCGSTTGISVLPWRCEPSPLPEQIHELVSGGRVRAVQYDHEAIIRVDNQPAEFQDLVQGCSVEIPARTKLQLLWDFEDYVCGYPCLSLDEGVGSHIQMEWAEALYESSEPEARSPKGNRSEISGKSWLGFGDAVEHPGGNRTYEPLWWRSGRYLRLLITTAEDPLVIRDARPHRTGYPFAPAWAFACDKKWEGIFRICEKGLRNSVHETFVDCPYYEQMQYVGDTRVQALTWLAITGDVRPVQRALELFDRSRWFNGFVAERCPSSPVQMSATYSLIQPLMLRDFCYWANEPAVVKRLLTGTRCALENAVACLDDTGLPSNLPGWLFVDWVKTHGWGGGNPLGDEPVLSAPVALHLPLGLQAAAEVEALVGDARIAARWREMAAAVLERIFKTYWNSEYKILADNREHSKFSEHAQALALACDGVPGDYRRGMEAGLIIPPVELARASVYFSFYVHDALLRSRQADAVIDRFAFWDHLEAQGFLTTVEAPEPSRSDCHGWGAHPLYHALSGFAGIQPAEPGFARARIAPQFGGMQTIRARLPTPHGVLSADFTRMGDHLNGTVESPVPLELIWEKYTTRFARGRHSIALA